MAITLPLEQMSRTEKLIAMEALWADLSGDADYTSPAWHEEALNEAADQVTAGTAVFSDWAAAKQRILRKAARGK
jgi:hypothetical protein